MTLIQYPLEGTPGTTITTANSGLSNVTASGGATALYQTNAAFQGSTGAEFTANGTNAAFAQAAFNAPATQGAVSYAFKIPSALPAADITFGTIYDTANARIISLVYTAAGAVKTNDKANVQLTILTTAQATAGTWVRFEYVVTALSATAGAFSIRAYNAAGTQIGSTATSTTANTGTTAMSYLRFGQLGTVAYTINIDAVQTNDGATTEIGPLTSSAPPVVNGVVTANMAVLDATSSTGNQPFTYAISPTTNVATISAGKYAVPSGVTYTVTVTDANQQATAKQFVIAAGSSGVVVRTQVRVGGVWTTPVGS